MPMEWIRGVFLPFTLLAMSCKAYTEGTFLLLLSAGDWLLSILSKAFLIFSSWSLNEYIASSYLCVGYTGNPAYLLRCCSASASNSLIVSSS
jgi:hypothetical protein